MRKLHLTSVCLGLSFATLSFAIDEIPRAPIGVCEKPAPKAIVRAVDEPNPTIALVGGGLNDQSNPPQLIDAPPTDAAPEPNQVADPVPVDASNGLDVDELVALAINQHPGLHQAQAAVDKARGLQFQSTRAFNPVVGYAASEVGNEGRLGQQGVFVSQTFVRGNKLHLNAHIYGVEIDRMNHAAQFQALRVARQVRQRYFDLVYSRRRVQVLQRLLAVSEKNLSIVQSRFEADEISRTEVLAAQLEVKEIALSLRKARITAAAAEKRLATAMGLAEDNVSSVVAPPSTPPTELDRDAIWKELNAASPELAMARANIQKAEWEICRARAEPVGNLQTQFSVQYDDSTQHTVAGIQIGVPIPVHDDNRGAIRAMQADYTRACHEEKRLKLSLRERFVTAFADYESAVESRTTSADEMLPIAQKNLELTSQLYDAGEAEFTQLLNAQRMYLKITVALLEADLQLWGIVSAFDQLLVDESFDAPQNAVQSAAAGR